MTTTTNRVALRLGILSLALAQGCADPPPADELERLEGDVAAVAAVEGAEASAQETELAEPRLSVATPDQASDDAIRNYRGPRLAIEATPPLVEAGVPITLSVQVTTNDGVAMPTEDDMEFEWRVPEGWTIEGEGDEITATPPDELPGGDVDIGVTVTQGARQLVRGGVMLRSNG